MKKRIGNFILEGWKPTPVEKALMNDYLEQMVNESADSDTSDIPSDFLEVQDYDAAMEEIKSEINKWLESE